MFLFTVCGWVQPSCSVIISSCSSHLIIINSYASTPGVSHISNFSSSLSTEVKQLKQLVRNIIDPSRDLGHVDRQKDKAQSGGSSTPSQTTSVAQRAAEPANAQSSEQASPKRNSKESTTTDEKTIPTDPEAAIAIGPLEDEEEAKGKGKDQGQGKACEDCS